MAVKLRQMTVRNDLTVLYSSIFICLFRFYFNNKVIVFDFNNRVTVLY